MRRHHSACGEPDAHLTHIDELVDDEVGTGIGQRRISYSRTDALIALQMLVFDAQLLGGSIAQMLRLTSSCNFSAVASANRSQSVCAIILR